MKDRKKLKKKLDKVFSEYIRERDDYRCFTCGRVKDDGVVIQCGHLFSRVSNSTRWDEKNAHAQCAGCNLKHEHDFETYRRAFVERYGQKEYDKLYAKFSGHTKYSLGELEFMIKLYRDKLKKLKERNATL